jgi:hypothetical protein
MLAGLLKARRVIEYIYGEMAETSHLRTRLPTATKWEVNQAIHDVLHEPCGIVTKAQSQNTHWLLSDAIYSVAKLSASLRKKHSEEVSITVADDEGRTHQ